MTLKQMDNPQGHIPSNACERALAGDIFRYGLPAGCAAESAPRELYILLLLRKIWKILDEYRKSKNHNYTYGSDSADRKNLWQSVDW